MIAVRRVFWAVLTYRIFNGLLLQTYFVPDEYWQSLEPAHKLVFGYGYLTWEWKQDVRSYIYPLCFAAVYWVLKITNLDSRDLVVLMPSLLQALFAAIGDVYLFKLTRLLHGDKVAVWTLLCWCCTWFGMFCMPRTLANSAETVLLLFGLYRYPWPNTYRPEKRPGVWQYLAIATLATIVRPTAAIAWIPLFVLHFLRVQQKIRFLVQYAFSTVLPVVFLSVLIDRLCSGHWMFSLWNFFLFNALQGGSAFFGSHPWHWYFTAGWPVIAFIHIIPIALGIYKARDRTLFYVSLWYTFAHSFIAHKEWRFLLPCLPLLCIYAGQWIDHVSTYRRPSRSLVVPSSAAPEDKIPKSARSYLALLFVISVPLALYTLVLHQRGALDVTKYLHNATLKTNSAVWLLMPCHSTPFYSHVHSTISMRFLTCEPNFGKDPNYVDESDLFYMDPLEWVKNEWTLMANVSDTALSPRSEAPSHIVMYERLWPKLQMFLKTQHYKLCASFFHTHFIQSNRQSSFIYVACNVS